MGILKMIMKAEADNDYLRNCCAYVSGGHTIPNCFGGINVDPELAYYQMMRVKQYFGKTSGNQLVHFIISFNKNVYDDEAAWSMGYRIANYYSGKYQIVFGVHYDHRTGKNGRSSSYLHLHMIMNSVSFIDGKMFAHKHGDIYDFVKHIRQVTGDKDWNVQYSH